MIDLDLFLAACLFAASALSFLTAAGVSMMWLLCECLKK